MPSFFSFQKAVLLGEGLPGSYEALIWHFTVLAFISPPPPSAQLDSKASCNSVIQESRSPFPSELLPPPPLLSCLQIFFLPGQTSMLLRLCLQMWYLPPPLYTMSPAPLMAFFLELVATISCTIPARNISLIPGVFETQHSSRVPKVTAAANELCAWM